MTALFASVKRHLNEVKGEAFILSADNHCKHFGPSSDILSVLIWVQTVCKVYQQMTKVSTNKGRGNYLHVATFVVC